MKKILLSLIAALFIAENVNAGILTNSVNNYSYPDYYYNNGYKYNRKYHPQTYPKRYRKSNPYYYPPYYGQPVIYRTKIRKKSEMSTNEKLVTVTLSGIRGIEKKIFNQTFDFDNLKTRMERLEQKIFGAIQNGTLEERFDVLKSASDNYKKFNPDFSKQSFQNKFDSSYSDSYHAPIFSGSTGSNWKNTLWGNFRNQLTGTPTGFTPAMDPAYMDYFEAERAMKEFQTNQKHYYSNSTTGNSSGVTILD